MNSCDIRKPNLTEADLDDYVNYFVQLRSQLRTSMIAGIDNEPGMKMIQNQIEKHAITKGVTLQTAHRQIIEELSEPADMERLRESLRRQIKQKSEAKQSMVPEGREKEFSALVFQEQVENALLQSLDIDLASTAWDASKTSHTDGIEQSKYVLEGLQNRLASRQ